MYTAIVLLPLLGALVAGFGYRAVGERTAIVTALLTVAVAALLSWVALFGHQAGEPPVSVLRWIRSGDLEVFWAIRADRMSLLMAMAVTSVSALAHLSAIGFTAESETSERTERFDGPGRARLIAYLSFLTFAMLLMVTADTLLQLFAGWEAVAAAAFLLSGFWYKRPLVDAAALRVFIVNRFGQAALLLGIVGIYVQTGSLQLDIIAEMAGTLDGPTLRFLGLSVPANNLIAILLLLGIAARAAMVAFHTWPASAAEAPAPGAALVLGVVLTGSAVFFVVRLQPVLELAPSIQSATLLVSGFSAVLTAAIASQQSDIRRILAYLASAQGALTIAGATMGGHAAAIVHAAALMVVLGLLCLGSGGVMRALDRERDLRKMGGLKAKMPGTHVVMVVGALGLVGLGLPMTPLGLGGHASQDILMQSVFAGAGVVPAIVFLMLLVSLALSAFAIWRFIFLVFHGDHRTDKAVWERAIESSQVMLTPLYLLTLGVVAAGIFAGAIVQGNGAQVWWDGVALIPSYPENPWWVSVAPTAAAVVGVGFAAFVTASGKRPASRDARNPTLANALYLDAGVDAGLVQPTRSIGEAIATKIDGKLIDGAIHAAGPGLLPWLTRFAARMQTGFLYHYALVMLIGLGVIVMWFTIAGVR